MKSKSAFKKKNKNKTQSIVHYRSTLVSETNPNSPQKSKPGRKTQPEFFSQRVTLHIQRTGFVFLVEANWS